MFPTRQSAGNLYLGDNEMTRAFEVLKNGIITPPHKDWLKIDDKIYRQLQLVLLGKTTPEKALTEPAVEIDSILLSSKKPVVKHKDLPVFIKILVFITIFLGILYFVLYSIANWKKIRKAQFAYFFITPALSVFVLFLAYPLIQALILAFQEYRLSGDSLWVGFNNFIFGVFNNKIFWSSMKNTVLYSLVRVPFTVFISLLIATFIYPLSDKAQTIFRGAFYLPGVISLVVMAMIWRWLYNPNYGLLNQILLKLGVIDTKHLVPWLTDPQTALMSLMLMAVCTIHGAGVIIYLAAMNNIPVSLYELAGMEGASGFQKWAKITVPLLRGTTLYLLVMNTIASFQVFTQVYVMTKGGPGYSTYMAIPLIYFSAFSDWDFGVAAAQSLIVFLCVVMLSLVQFKWLQGRADYV